MGIFNEFNKAKAVFEQAALAKEELQKAEKLAQIKHLREAVTTAEQIIASWSSDPSLGEQLARQLALGDFLTQVTDKLHRWRQLVIEADQLAARATAIIQRDAGNPWDTTNLSEALALFKRCVTLVYDQKFTQAINDCEWEIRKRQKFQAIFEIAQEKYKQLFFQEAFNNYSEAKKLYAIDIVENSIADCLSKFKQEQFYEITIQKANQSFKQGKLKVGIQLLESAVSKFPRADGIELLENWRNILSGKQSFRDGLKAEKENKIHLAINKYQQALNFLPNEQSYKLRLATLHIKNKSFSAAISLLIDINEPKAAYIRGFAHAKLGNLQQAYREWQHLSYPGIEAQRENIKILAQRERLIALQEIERLVDQGNLSEAQAHSSNFIQKFGIVPLVQTNLEAHIQPRLETEIWENQDWKSIADQAEEIWLQNPNINSLHNWAVAYYYYYQTDSDQLINFIIALATSIVNLHIDQSLINLPWLENNSVNYQEVFADLKQLLETEIDAVKDSDMTEYFQLRDRFRLEFTTIRLINDNSGLGIKVNNLFLTPGCYQFYREKSANFEIFKPEYYPNYEDKIILTLYTDWGLAVAACLENDVTRAIQIKPPVKPISTIEIFAERVISYYQGCYYLQEKLWRKAVEPLKAAQPEIAVSEIWPIEINRLCILQRHAITDLSEHLDFAQFWYELIDSQASTSYLAEYKTEAIREKLFSEEITFEKAWLELKQIQKIDPNNPVVLDLIDKVELTKELDEIDRLLRRGKMAEAVKYAKRSRHDKVRYIVAEFFIEILIDSIKKGDLSNLETIQQLGRWAYEICPNEPEFQEVYYSLKLR